MKITIHRSKGFIIIFALMIISLMVFLTQQLVNGVLVSSNFVSIVTQREQAKMLAISGIQIATKQLLDLDKKAKKKDGVEKTSVEDTDSKTENDDEENGANKDGMANATKKNPHDKKFFEQILPFLNRWRIFSFDEKRDGFAAELRICLTCEEGKINLNEAFDFKKQEFKKEYGALLKSLEIKGKLQAGELATKLQEFLAKRARKLEDVSELAQIPACKNLDIFHKPPERPEKKGDPELPSINLALSDIFTIWTTSQEINPLLFSNGLCAMFTLRQPLATDPEKMKAQFKQLKEQFKPDFARDWDAHWEILQPFYQKKPPFFKDMQGIFSKEFGPRTYSVISYATVGKVTQRVMAIVKKVEKKQDSKKSASADDEQPQETPNNKEPKDKDSGPKFEMKVLRLYWI